MEPQVAASIGLSTLHLNRNDGKKNKGISIYFDIITEKVNFIKYHLVIFSKSRERLILDGHIEVVITLRQMRLSQTRLYLQESNGCNFSIPNRLRLYQSEQTILLLQCPEQTILSEKLAIKSYTSSTIKPDNIIQAMEIASKYACALHITSHTNEPQPTAKHKKSTNAYIVIQILYKYIIQLKMSNSSRYEQERSRSSDRKSLQKQQINLLLYKNIQLQTNKSKENTLTKTITISRSKAKSSQGSYREQMKKHSVEILIPQTKAGLTNWVQNGIRFEPQIKRKQKITRNHFQYHHVIGRGGFGKVWKVEQKKTSHFFAMKQMSKSVIITKKSVPSVVNQKTLLTQLKNTFLVNMYYAFQDRQTLYLVMDLMPGGDLRYHICKRKRFNEDQTRFFIACIFAGLQYLHNKQIIHRDIKPENLVIDYKGYIHITDLGIAKQYRSENNTDTSGTPGYMAPEVMCRQNHSFCVDYYALGVISYELMMGRRPYTGRNRKQIRDQILSKQTIIKKQEIPEGWSIEAADFTNKLIQRKPMLRLGWGGAQQIKQHPWLKNFPWQKLQKKQIVPPFIPDQNQDNFDGRHHLTVEDQQFSAMIKQNTLLLRKDSVQELFEGYTYEDQTKMSQMNTTSSQLGKRK